MRCGLTDTRTLHTMDTNQQTMISRTNQEIMVKLIKHAQDLTLVFDDGTDKAFSLVPLQMDRELAYDLARSIERYFRRKGK